MKKPVIACLLLGLSVVVLYCTWIVFTFLDGGWYANLERLNWYAARGDVHQMRKLLRWNPHLAKEPGVLHNACHSEQLASVDVLIQYGADLNARDEWGETPLHYAAKKANGQITRLLLAKGSDPGAQDKFGNLPLHAAALSSDVTKSFRPGAPPDARFAGTLETVESLLPRGADTDFQTKGGKTALQFAAAVGNRRVVEYLVSRGSDVNSKDREGFTPLVRAIYSESFECAKFLREKGATLEFVSAAGLGEVEFVRHDLEVAENGPSTEKKIRALYAACQAGEAAIVKLLLDDGVTVEGMQDWGVTPLHDAVRRNRKDIVRLLIDRGASVNANNWESNGPLYVAVYHGHHDMVRLLLEKGANVNQRDKYGETVLHCVSAPVAEDLPMVELLLKSGADPNARSINGGTPLQRAVNRTEIENMLRRFGAK